MSAFDWIDAVGSPILVLSEDLDTIVYSNAPARRLLGARNGGGRDRDLDGSTLQSVLGETVVEAIRRRFAGGAEAIGSDGPTLLADVEVLHRRHVLSCRPYASHWVLSIEPSLTLDPMDLGADVFRKMFDAIPVGVDLFDKHYNSIFTNRYVIETLGYYGVNSAPTFDVWFECSYPEPGYRAAAQKAWVDAVEAVDRGAAIADQGDWWVHCEDGETRRLRFILMPLGRFNLQVTLDMTERYRSDSDLRRLAFFDELTGASTRAHFRTEAEQVTRAAREQDRPLVLALVDVDEFKLVNDSEGHPVGDMVLREVVARCRMVLGPDAILARLGGDEFVAVPALADRRDAKELAGQIVATVGDRPVEAGSTDLRVSVSVGAFSGPARAFGLDEMLTIADEALYAAKRAGRNRFRVIER